MEFNLPRRKQKDMGIEMGPLMDIVFILLIFFVVTSSFTRETGVDVTKPQAQTALRGNYSMKGVWKRFSTYMSYISLFFVGVMFLFNFVMLSLDEKKEKKA